MKNSFDELSALYRADAPPSEGLVAAVRRGRRKLTARLAGALAAFLFCSTLGIGFFLTEGDLPSMLFAVIQVGLPLAIVVRWTVSARQSWKAAGQTTADFLELDVERLEHEVRMLRFSAYVMPVFVPALVTWQVLHARAHSDVYRAHQLTALVSFGGMWVLLGAVVVVGVVLEGRKTRRKLAQAQATLAAVSGD